jgi:hypothetical protein
VAVFVGFARSYFLKGYFGAPPLPSLLVHVHGAVSTGWIVLFVSQILLVAQHRVGVHRRLGIMGAVWAGVPRPGSA